MTPPRKLSEAARYALRAGRLRLNFYRGFEWLAYSESRDAAREEFRIRGGVRTSKRFTQKESL